MAIACMLACARIGAIHYNVSSTSSATLLAPKIKDAGAAVVFTSNITLHHKTKEIKLFDNMIEAISKSEYNKVKKVFVTHLGQSNMKDLTQIDIPNYMEAYLLDIAILDECSDCPPQPMSGEDKLFIAYTSGTTSTPKGLVHTQAGYLLYATVSYQIAFDYEEGDISAFLADMGWIVSHTYMTYGVLSSGGTTLLYDGQLEEHDLNFLLSSIVEEHKVTQLILSPLQLGKLKSKQVIESLQPLPSCLKLLGSVGECLPMTTKKWYKDNLQFTIFDHYWQTETGGVLLSPKLTKINGTLTVSDGMYPFFGVQPLLLNPERGMKEVHGDNVKGNLYLTKPLPGMARTIYGDDHKRFKKDYWTEDIDGNSCFYTRDSALRDEFSSYHINGRIDDVITVGQYRFDPAELEDVLNEDKNVAKSACIGFRDDDSSGIMSFVVLNSQALSCREMEKEFGNRLTKHRPEIAEFPCKFQFVKDFPTTKSLKTSRHHLRELTKKGGFHKETDYDTLDGPCVPKDISIQFNVMRGEGLAHESDNYREMYKATVKFSNLFWSGLADNILKHEEVNVCDMSSGHIEWFKGESLNVTEQCLDKHIDYDNIALKSEAGDEITYK